MLVLCARSSFHDPKNSGPAAPQRIQPLPKSYGYCCETGAHSCNVTGIASACPVIIPALACLSLRRDYFASR